MVICRSEAAYLTVTNRKVVKATLTEGAYRWLALRVRQATSGHNREAVRAKGRPLDDQLNAAAMAARPEDRLLVNSRSIATPSVMKHSRLGILPAVLQLFAIVDRR